ncbi:hypothetical protein GQ44DRAFT_776087 [Phaeosphaeriaceae sp. PMI808]|nr:hypothetical protein GQ44DRAFT_776087 [Phaeosphaeriaceae sp. PMI808]
MSLIGQVFNKALSKNISVYLSESGDGFKPALQKVKCSFESGALFKDDDMKLMERVVVTNMSHQNPGDPNAHYSVQGETGNGIKVKGGHVAENPSNQTASHLLNLVYCSLTSRAASQLSVFLMVSISWLLPRYLFRASLSLPIVNKNVFLEV